MTPRHTGLLTLLGRVYVAEEDWARADQVRQTLAKVGTAQATAQANELQLQILAPMHLLLLLQSKLQMLKLQLLPLFLQLHLKQLHLLLLQIQSFGIS